MLIKRRGGESHPWSHPLPLWVPPPGECAAGAAARAPREAAVIFGAGSFPPAPSAAGNSLAL